MSSDLRRWAVPVVVAVGIVGATAAPRAFAGSGHPDLPATTAAELLAAVQQSQVTGLSGTVKTVANLGLPQLPDRLATAGSGLPALLTGSHLLRVWADGRDHQRVALLGDLSETDVIHNGADLWTYTSTTNAVTHRILGGSAAGDAAAGAAPEASAEPTTADLTPQAQAQTTLASMDPTTVVRVEGTSRVAGRPAYQLTLTPRTNETLVRSVRIAVDAATSVPLRVQIYPSGAGAPAWSTAFTEVSFDPPAAKVFNFVPPAGATVSDSAKTAPGDQTGESGTSDSSPTTIGDGWTSILALPAGSLDAVGLGAADGSGSGDGNGQDHGSLLDRVTTSVPEGRLLTTRLLSLLITPDGRVYIGAVPGDAVRRAAAANR